LGEYEIRMSNQKNGTAVVDGMSQDWEASAGIGIGTGFGIGDNLFCCENRV
jgi:hypothetical protein